MRHESGFGPAWLALTIALALHVTDEALTGFLNVYNPTVLALRETIRWLPLPIFRFDVWLTGLIAGILLLFALSPFAFRATGALRPAGYVLAALMMANGTGHIIGTIAGRTTAGVRFPRPMPGFYSSPFLIIASIWLLFSLRRTRRDAGSAQSSSSTEPRR